MFFFFNDTATTEIYTLSLHDALPIYRGLDDLVIDGSARRHRIAAALRRAGFGSLAFSIPLGFSTRSEEHTSELQSRQYLVCRLLLEKKNQPNYHHPRTSTPLPTLLTP